MKAIEHSKEDRLAEFFRRLTEAPAAQTADAAKELLAGVLNEVENEMTDIPYDPEQWASDGRLYPVLDDNWEDLPDGRWVGRSRGHQTFVGANGAIEIKRRSDGHVEFAKPGADGKGVGP